MCELCYYKNIDLIKISVCFHIPTVYMNRQLQYKLFVWIMLLHIIMYLSVLKSGSSPHIKYNSEIDFICQRNKSWLYILLQSESFFTFFRGRNQRCMNQNQFWCQNVFKDVKLSNLIFPLVRVRQTYRNSVECFRLIKLIRLAFNVYK